MAAVPTAGVDWDTSNPYDPDVVDVSGEVLRPDGTTQEWPAFWDGSMWRGRYPPMIAGEPTVTWLIDGAEVATCTFEVPVSVGYIAAPAPAGSPYNRWARPLMAPEVPSAAPATSLAGSGGKLDEDPVVALCSEEAANPGYPLGESGFRKAVALPVAHATSSSSGEPTRLPHRDSSRPTSGSLPTERSRSSTLVQHAPSSPIARP